MGLKKKRKQSGKAKRTAKKKKQKKKAEISTSMLEEKITLKPLSEALLEGLGKKK
jgi:hypothetical protein